MYCPDVVDERGNVERYRDPLHQILQSEKTAMHRVKELMLNAFTLADAVQKAKAVEAPMSRVADESLRAYQKLPSNNKQIAD